MYLGFSSIRAVLEYANIHQEKYLSAINNTQWNLLALLIIIRITILALIRKLTMSQEYWKTELLLEMKKELYLWILKMKKKVAICVSLEKEFYKVLVKHCINSQLKTCMIFKRTVCS